MWNPKQQYEYLTALKHYWVQPKSSFPTVLTKTFHHVAIIFKVALFSLFTIFTSEESPNFTMINTAVSQLKYFFLKITTNLQSLLATVNVWWKWIWLLKELWFNSTKQSKDRKLISIPDSNFSMIFSGIYPSIYLL